MLIPRAKEFINVSKDKKKEDFVDYLHIDKRYDDLKENKKLFASSCDYTSNLLWKFFQNELLHSSYWKTKIAKN